MEAEVTRKLRVAGEAERQLAEFGAKVRAVGERWAGTRPSELTELTELLRAAADDPELEHIACAAGQLLECFVEGFVCGHTSAAPTSPGLVADLIDGRQPPGEVLGRLAIHYVAVLARPAVERRGGVAVQDWGRGVLSTRRSGVLVLLVPDGETAVLERITGQLAAEGWVATARRAVTELADAYAEASEVLRLVAAAGRPAGVYSMTDVLIEYAFTRNDVVTKQLAELIQPLRDNQILWQTLVTLVQADFNRNQAARDLYIHRSTLDYRLQRIAKITGCDPAGTRGARLLSAALVVDALVGLRSCPGGLITGDGS